MANTPDLDFEIPPRNAPATPSAGRSSSAPPARRSAPARRPPRSSGGGSSSGRPPRSYDDGSSSRGGWRWLRILFMLLVLGVVGGAAVGLAAYFHFSKGLPALFSLSDYRPSLVTRVYARDYQLLGEFFFQRRQFIRMSEVPRRLVNAFLAIEDAKFYQHPGIDLVGIFRAALANVRAGRAVQGASTITQQVAKTFLLSSVKSLDRKVKEIILALRIEREFSKDEIMELYINQIYLGAGAYGVGAAARIYFDKDVSELSLAQVAMLAGLPKAPNHYSPWRNPENAQRRQRLVLNRMAEVGFVTQAEAEAAAAEPIGLARPQEPLDTIAPHYLEHVRRTILGDWGEGQLYKGGLDVYTPLDPNLQRHAQDAVRQGLIEYDRRHGYRGPLDHVEKVQEAAVRQKWLHSKAVSEFSSVSDYQIGLVVAMDNRKAKVLLGDESTVELPFEGVSWARKRLDEKKKPGKLTGPPPKTLADVFRVGDVILVEAPNDKHKTYQLAQEPDAEAALVSLDPHTGQVLAMVGGYNYDRSEFNRATQGQRQPGSSFKPFIYAAALDGDLTPTTLIDDSPMPLAYRDPVTKELKVWRAQNYEHKFYGPTTVRVGLVHSRNLVTIRILKRVGMAAAIPYLKKFGFEIPENRHDLSLALGTMGFTPLKMASAYAVFANGGKLVEPVVISRVQDRLGRTVFRHRGGDCMLCHQDIDRTSVLASELGGQAGREQGVFDRPVLDPATIYQVTNLMKGVVTHGTAQFAKQLQRPVAGKTGTTNGLRDAWFVGFSPSLVASVWVGMDDNTTLGQKETGGRAALPIWVKYMAKALQNVPVTDFVMPKGIVLEEVDPETGYPAVDGSGNRVMEAFKPGQGPISVGTTVPPGVVPGDGLGFVPGAPAGQAPVVGDGFY
ncbi:MAG: PBP1A family penicillin-binding protein [Magnetococcales bacterium]|nr:PBP1A family penicillin-binding protein [Magnetococcales bacterium]